MSRLRFARPVEHVDQGYDDPPLRARAVRWYLGKVVERHTIEELPVVEDTLWDPDEEARTRAKGKKP